MKKIKKKYRNLGFYIIPVNAKWDDVLKIFKEQRINIIAVKAGTVGYASLELHILVNAPYWVKETTNKAIRCFSLIPLPIHNPFRQPVYLYFIDKGCKDLDVYESRKEFKSVKVSPPKLPTMKP